ncbi:bifunctional alpha/beta hydrolase/OsmC family protein [Demequina aurantiaca]|uniref:bifunctional alpha/beta hydrolase/OsmC family protein n=1 Tax=Demequina aurantiaca TaxID=676200 RepID=UPI003D356BD8
MAAGRAPERVEFVGSQGEKLAGRLELPEGEPLAYALFAHCFTCGKDSVAATRISRALTSAGVAVLRFDFTGLGHSGGDFGNSNFTTNVEDLVRAAGYLRSDHAAPSILIGHSLGGAATLVAAPQIPEVQAVVTIGAPADPAHVLELMPDSLAQLEENGSAEVSLGGRSFRIGRQFIHDLQSQRDLAQVSHLSAALLVLHSPVDQIVSIDNARQIFDAAHHPKSFVALDGADHLLTRKGDAQFAADVIGAWVGRYVSSLSPETPPASGPSALSQLADGAVRVAENANGPYGQTVSTNEHAILADEPAPIGSATGMSPYDLLLAGLGACTSMTLRMYAERKRWPLESVEVTLRHSRVHSDDCADCESTPAALERIERTIVVSGDLSPEQRQSLLAIADKCPVHRTLHANVQVATSIVPAGVSE